MKAFGSVQALAIGAALAGVGSASAIVVATADGGKVSSRHTNVVGGGVVHPPRAILGDAIFPPTTLSPDITRQGYVVDGELVGLGR